jgi:hypothetical protein
MYWIMKKTALLYAKITPLLRDNNRYSREFSIVASCDNRFGAGGGLSIRF